MTLTLSAHAKAQIGRFLRLFVATIVPEVVALFATKLTLDRAAVAAIVALVPGALETAWRQLNQVVPVATLPVAPTPPVAPVPPVSPAA